MMDKNKNIEVMIKGLKEMDREKFYYIGAKLKCPHCDKDFGIGREYIGIVTCPYCGKYVEG